MIKNKLSLSIIIKTLFSSIAFIQLCIPVFDMTGSVVKPLLISVLCSVIICCILTLFHSSARIAGNSMMILMLFWLIFAITKEINLQIEAGFVFSWIDFFYYDKLLILGTIWLSVSVFFCVRRLISAKKTDDEYAYFFKTDSIAFLIFYIFLLVYSFILIRLRTAEYPFRFQPFVTIQEYLNGLDSIPYEIFMMFFGNLLYFTPLGYIFSRLLRNKNRITKILINALFPILVFTLLEFSQYFFRNGYCEFDDMMMNTLGFWLGNFLFWCSNKFATLISRGRYTSFWN